MRTITRAGSRVAGLLTAVAVACAAAGTPAVAQTPDPVPVQWQPDLPSGQGAGVVVRDGEARFDPDTAHGAPADPAAGTEGSADPADVVPTGLLTLRTHPLDRPSAEITSALDATTGPGSTATLDVRGRRDDGGWTEWIPSEAGPAPGSGVAELPEAVREVQGRIVLTATGADRPSVRGVTLTAAPDTGPEGVKVEAGPLNYSVFATREGLVGGTTANGHKIGAADRFVALPSRRALSANGASDYSVKVCAPNGRCAFAPVWDIGPWNTQDDYWNAKRERFGDLPQGVPEAQAAYRDGYNGGKDQFGRRPVNPAGIDLSDGLFHDGLGLGDNSQVSVDYLWTGNVRLAKVSVDGAADVELRSAPDGGAPVVGIAADSADVPVRCRAGSGDGWIQVGAAQFLPASALTAPDDTPPCPAGPTGG